MEGGTKDRRPPPLPPPQQPSVKFRKDNEDGNLEKMPQPDAEDIGFWTASKRQYMVSLIILYQTVSEKLPIVVNTVTLIYPCSQSVKLKPGTMGAAYLAILGNVG